MKKKILAFFILALVLSCCTFRGLSHWLNLNQENDRQKEVAILHEAITERFELLLYGSLSAGIVTARYFSQANYDAEVYPQTPNLFSLTKISQNHSQLAASLAKGEKFWLSPPFKLFQDGLGFAFYIPMLKEKSLVGWAAPVISEQKFMEKFKIAHYLKDYHLTIEDALTKKNFFTSADLPSNRDDVIMTQKIIFGRKINFYSWPVHHSFSYKASWLLCLLISLALSTLATYAFRIKTLRKQEIKQLGKIKASLEITASEASGALDVISEHLNSDSADGMIEKDKVADYIFYVSNLLEQLSTSTKLCRPAQHPQHESLDVMQILQDQNTLFQNMYKEKKVSIKLDQSNLYNFKIHANRWLLSHCVFGNILRILIINAPRNSEIQINLFKDNGLNIISFHGLVAKKNESHHLDDILKRGLEIARETILISQGQLETIDKHPNELTIALNFDAR